MNPMTATEGNKARFGCVQSARRGRVAKGRGGVGTVGECRTRTASLTRAASALRDRGNIWQGCYIAIPLSEDEYVPRPLIHVRHVTAQLAPKEAPHSSVAGWPWPS
jgi:hypothetical protein